MQILAPEFPGVRFAGVSIKGGRAQLRALVRSHDLSFPIGIDEEGVLPALYKMATCPQVTFAYPGGIVQSEALLVQPPLSHAARPRARARGGGCGREAGGAAAVSRPTRGWCEREVEEELPGLSLVHVSAAVDRARRGSPPGAEDAAEGALQPLGGGACDRPATAPGPGGLPGVLQAHRFGPRCGAHSDRGGDARADDAGGFPLQSPAGRRTADRAPGHRRAGVGAGCCHARGACSGSARVGRASPLGARWGVPRSPRCCPRGSWSWRTPPRRWRCCSGRSPSAIFRVGGTGELVLFTLQVPGVPSLHVEEALWMWRRNARGTVVSADRIPAAADRGEAG